MLVVVAAPAQAAPYDNACATPGALTDRVDRTIKVSGSGWATCRGNGVEQAKLKVVLYRNGVRVRTVIREKYTNVTSLTAYVAMKDKRKGKQKWRTKATLWFKPYSWWVSYKKVHWSKALYH